MPLVASLPHRHAPKDSSQAPYSVVADQQNPGHGINDPWYLSARNRYFGEQQAEWRTTMARSRKNPPPTQNTGRGRITEAQDEDKPQKHSKVRGFWRPLNSSVFTNRSSIFPSDADHYTEDLLELHHDDGMESTKPSKFPRRPTKKRQMPGSMSAVEFQLYYMSQLKKGIDREAEDSAPRWKQFIKKQDHFQARVLDNIKVVSRPPMRRGSKHTLLNPTFPGVSKNNLEMAGDSKPVTKVLPAPPASTPMGVPSLAPVVAMPSSQIESPAPQSPSNSSRASTKQRSVVPQVNQGNRGRISSKGSKDESSEGRKGSTASQNSIAPIAEDTGNALQDAPAPIQDRDDDPGAQTAQNIAAPTSSNDGGGLTSAQMIIEEQLMSHHHHHELPSAELIGMKQDTIDEAARLFRKFDNDGSGSINTLELRSLLRFLGILPSTRRIYELCKEYDTDDTGELEIDEFLYLVAEIKRDEREAIPVVFDKFVRDESGHISGPQLGDVLRFLGREPTMEQVHKLLEEFDKDGSTSLDLEEFEMCVDHHTEMQKNIMRERGGFEEEEIASFREMFDSFDRDRSGDLTFAELTQVLKLLGLLPRTKEGQVALMAKMKSADKDGSGSLDFMEFIQLMRCFSDEVEMQEFDEEQRAAKQAGFCDAEVTELQEVYDNLQGEENGDFTLSSARSFLRSLGVVCTSDQVNDLRLHFDRFAVATEPQAQFAGSRRLSKRRSQMEQQVAFILPFHRFLLFVGYLVSKDFAGLKSASSKLVASRQLEAQNMEALMSSVSEASKKEDRERRKAAKKERRFERQQTVPNSQPLSPRPNVAS